MRSTEKASHVVKQGWTAKMTLKRMLLIKTLLTGPHLNDYIFFLIFSLLQGQTYHDLNRSA